MDKLIRLEEAALFGLGIGLFAMLGYTWWVFPALLLLPDLSMAGYAAGSRSGAVVYNLFHHRGVALAVYGAGLAAGVPGLQLSGVILFSHSSMDRMFGYGLKYADSFRHMHLGGIGNNDKKSRRGHGQREGE